MSKYLTWMSHRREREEAIARGERMARWHEEDLGRALTADELREVHERAREVTGELGRQSRTADLAERAERERAERQAAARAGRRRR